MRKLSVVPLLLLPGLLFGQLPGSGVETTFANRREFRIPFNPGDAMWQTLGERL